MSNFIENYEKNNSPKNVTGKDAILSNKAAQEIQAAMVIAKRFPRDPVVSYGRIMDSCSRISLAEQATYTYPRGNTKVTGPSIRLAEALAQGWGNIDSGIIELEQKHGKSEMMAYAWDLETNTRVTKVFTVAHRRDTKSGGYDLKDSRDIYELTANQGARRMRACILAVIPGDVIDKALEQCNKTLKEENSDPLVDRVAKMIQVFKKELGVSKKQIENYMGYNINSFQEGDVIKLGGVYKSIKDGMADAKDYFDQEADNPFEVNNNGKKNK